ncbi:hypothetical protein ACLOJK_019126 [Asimina triloba]
MAAAAAASASMPPTIRRVGHKPPPPCDFCSHSHALLYCRADSAKLCLACDRHVHSANALSRKHLRSQICDSCADAPATVRRCSSTADHLCLCHDCDWDAGPGPSHHHSRLPLEGFSGCPPALDIASLWGVDLSAKDSSAAAEDRRDSAFANWETLDSILPVEDSWIFKDPPVSRSRGSQDVMVVPCELPFVPKQSGGKSKQVMVVQQLTELLKKDLSHGGEAGADNSSNCDLSPETRGRNVVSESGNGGDVAVDTEQRMMQGTSYTSLLMWESNPVPVAAADQASQVFLQKPQTPFVFFFS